MSFFDDMDMWLCDNWNSWLLTHNEIPPCLFLFSLNQADNSFEHFDLDEYDVGVARRDLTENWNVHLSQKWKLFWVFL
jgi:hypothetical protein